MPQLKVGNWVVDRATNQILRGGEAVHLEPKAVDLLIALAKRAGEVVSREELLAEVWSGVVVGDDVLTQGVIKLRKALGDASKEPSYIQTIPKRGYRLIAPVTWLAAPSNEPQPTTGAAEETHSHSPASHLEPPPAATRRYYWMAGVVAAIAIAAYWVYSHTPIEGAYEPTKALTESIGKSPIDSVPKVIVHRFREVEGDPLQMLLARGITARLITDLGRFPDIRVISVQNEPGTSGTEPAKEAERAGYVVKGEVQRSDDKIRLYIHLTDAATGEALWAEQYDRAYRDLLSLQDELTRQVLNKIRVEVSDAELRRRARPYTRNLDAYEYFLRAQSGLLVRRKSENDAAREMYLKAIELDPTFARAHAGLALTYAADRRNGWTRDPAAALAKAFDVAKAAHQMDPDIPETCFALAFVHMERGELAQAIDLLRQAMRLNPSYADGYALLAGIETYRGRPRETIPLILTAIRLLPDAGHLYFLILGRAHFFLGDFESASMYLRQALARNPENVECHLYLAATLVRAGKHDQAVWEAEEIRVLEPSFRLREWLASYPLADAGLRERLKQAVATLNL